MLIKSFVSPTRRGRVFSLLNPPSIKTHRTQVDYGQGGSIPVHTLTFDVAADSKAALAMGVGLLLLGEKDLLYMYNYICIY